MTCDCRTSTSTSTSGYTVIVPAGCLGNTEIELQCKAPLESVYYQFSLQNRLQPSEMITSVVPDIADGTNVVIDNITIANQYFKCRISGGNLNTLAGIRFLITTNNNSVREFDVSLPILPAGVIKDGATGKSYVIGDKGGKGETGERGSLWYYGNNDPISSGIYNAQDAWLNVTTYDVFVYSGTEWKLDGNLKGGKGDQGNPGKDGTQILTSTVDPSQKEAAENLLWLNTATGDLFETVPVGDDQYTWSKIGSLKGAKGDTGATGDTGKTGDTGATGAEGKQGQRGSIWFFGSDNPTSGDIYIGGDCFLNTTTYDCFINNGTNWQENGNLKGTKGETGNDGISPTLSIGTVTTLDPDQQATASIDHNPNGKDALNLGLVKGDKGDIGATGATGAQGEKGDQGDTGASYENNGKTALDVQSLQLADINSVNVANIPDGKIFLDSKNNQLVIKQNNQWVALNNMSNFEIETTYKNNTGTFPINFAPLALVGSSDAVSGSTGLTAGYLTPDTSKALPTPTTLLIRADFKISSTDTTDSDYYILGYDAGLNIRINPHKKTVSVYNGGTKQYEMDYTTLGINLHDDKFHTLYFIINNSFKGYTCYAIDGIFFNRNLDAVECYLSRLRVRGAVGATVAPDVLIVKNIGISSKLPSLLSGGNITLDLVEFEGYYTLINNTLNNYSLTNGILLKPYSYLDSLNTVIPSYLNNSIAKNQALFNSDGLYGGNATLTSLLSIPTFTFECFFKYNSTYDTDLGMRRSILGNISTFSVGIKAGSNSEFTYKDYTTGKETTIVDSIEKDKFHTLAISCNNNIASFFVDGIKKATLPFNQNWNLVYLRGLDFNDYITLENALVIKNISFNVGYAKYYNDYDSSLTPNSPNSDGFFYPLTDGIISNQNIKSPIVKINMNDGDSFTLWTISNEKNTTDYTNLTPVKYDYSHQPPIQNTKFSRILLKDVQGNPVKESV